MLVTVLVHKDTNNRKSTISISIIEFYLSNLKAQFQRTNSKQLYIGHGFEHTSFWQFTGIEGGPLS